LVEHVEAKENIIQRRFWVKHVAVELEQQVIDFVRSLPPQPRQALRRAVKNLQLEQGDIRALEGELEGLYRLRVQRYRVIFHYDLQRDRRVIRCVYAATRSIVYEVFAQRVRELLE
jgi:mRNA interferase RelE/StbE